jgi:hypothetical protein
MSSPDPPGSLPFGQPHDPNVQVPGYSDYFCCLSQELQEEIIAHTEYQRR